MAIRAVGLLTGASASNRRINRAFAHAMRSGLADVKWPGRVQRLEENPAIFVDGAITVRSAESFVGERQREIERTGNRYRRRSARSRICRRLSRAGWREPDAHHH